MGSTFIRNISTGLGELAGFDDDKAYSFVSGLVIVVNFLLMMHYTAEAFVYNAVSKFTIASLWIATLVTLAGIRVVIHVRPTKKEM